MKARAVSIRNIPEDIYLELQRMAEKNRRSLQEQIRLILEQEVRLSRRSFLVNAAEWRERLRGRPLTDTVRTVRKDRQR